MATYKVLQDIEAEDKFLGPLTLRQFIYAGVTTVSLYLSFIALTKHAPFFLLVLLPPAAMAGILAWPWSGQQTTEVWLLAKVRFFLKPRVRKWDQSGVKDLVTITVPKRDEKIYTNGLDQTEVKSRLQALAQTIDSRGWAIKNVAVSLSQPGFAVTDEDSDRLISLANLPQEVSGVDIQAADDIMDERNNPIAMQFEQMIKSGGKQKRQGILAKMQEVRENTQQNKAANDNEPWFLQPGGGNTTAQQAVFTTKATAGPVRTTPDITASDEEQLLNRIHEQEQRMDLALGQSPKPSAKAQVTSSKIAAPTTKSAPQPTSPVAVAPVILKTIGNKDPNVAIIPHEANQPAGTESPDDEVVISLR